MEIQKAPPVLRISSNANQPAKDFSRLQAGATLNAVVINKLDGSAYMLKLLDGSLIRAHTDNPLQSGQILKLEVLKPGITPQLRIVWPEHLESTTPLLLQSALRQLLPKQVSLTDFTLALKQIAAVSAESTTPAQKAIQTTLGTLISKNDLTTADGVKQGIDNSGVFLETKLAHQLATQGDIKGQLLMLANTLQKTPLTSANPDPAHALPQELSKALDMSNALLTKTEGAIAHIVLDQLASLPQNNGQQTTWQVSIPFTDGLHADTANLKINREDSSNPAQPEPNWSVVLELNPPGMGTLNCKISLIDGKVNTYFWSDFADGITRIHDRLDVLAKGYTEAGLSVGNLDVVDAARMAQETSKKELMPTLLDEFA
jgi:Flagellar hook-length control protein FliK